MTHNKKFILSLFIVIIILVLLIIYLLATKSNAPTNSMTNVNSTNVYSSTSTNNAVVTTNTTSTTNSTSKVNTTANNSNSATTLGKSKTDIVKDLFTSDVLKKDSNNKDYKINNVKIESDATLGAGETFKHLYPDSTPNDIFATVTYSIEPIDINAGLAGNGEQQGDWVVNKVNCVYIKNNNGNYTIENVGTGW